MIQNALFRSELAIEHPCALVANFARRLIPIRVLVEGLVQMPRVSIQTAGNFGRLFVISMQTDGRLGQMSQGSSQSSRSLGQKSQTFRHLSQSFRQMSGSSRRAARMRHKDTVYNRKYLQTINLTTEKGGNDGENAIFAKGDTQFVKRYDRVKTAAAAIGTTLGPRL